MALLGALSIGAVVMGIARRSVALGLTGWVLVSLAVCALLAGRGLRRR
ncbi:MAG: hypothetical protein KGJ98_13085 [Chloroflexota bacterium]|nr:hypothetical protein [Chloroflexota bacterium]MDE3103157.1 hypothetical protein [Chloroflexota bacterium]